MKTNLILIRIGGLINLLAALLHLSFWNMFEWTHELTKLRIVNSNIMQMLNLFIIAFFVYVGLLLLFKTRAVLSTFIGRHFLGLLTTLWTARLAMEFYFPEGELAFAAVVVFTILCFSYPLISSMKIKYKIDNSEHLKQAWQAHALLPDFEIEDVWELPVEMNHLQTVGDMQKVFATAIAEISGAGIVGWLFQFRFFLGRLFGWDDEVGTVDVLPVGSVRARYANQKGLKAEDFSEKGGAQFVSVYQMKNEALSEIENETVHAAVHYGKVPKGNDSYAVHMTVYVKPKGLFGKMYMQLIKPIRLYIVYPIMLKVIGNHWRKYQQAQLDCELALA